MAAASARQLSSAHFGAAADSDGRLAWAAGRSRDALLARADELLQQAASYLPRLRPWLPRLQMQAMETYQRRFEELCANVRQGERSVCCTWAQGACSLLNLLCIPLCLLPPAPPAIRVLL